MTSFLYLNMEKSNTHSEDAKPQYGLDCNYYKDTFDSRDELLQEITVSGMDPNYNITKDGIDTGECAWDLIEPTI